MAQNDYVTISHDSIARQSTVRRLVEVSSGRTCTWCGNSRRVGDGSTPLQWLFEYGTERDDNGRVSWHAGLFCSKSCHDSYHG